MSTEIRRILAYDTESKVYQNLLIMNKYYSNLNCPLLTCDFVYSLYVLISYYSFVTWTDKISKDNLDYYDIKIYIFNIETVSLFLYVPKKLKLKIIIF